MEPYVFSFTGQKDTKDAREGFMRSSEKHILSFRFLAEAAQ